MLCLSTTIQEDVISMWVVPDKLKHKDSNFVYRTFVMLDNCSQEGFIKAILMKALQIRGQKTQITFKTLNREENQSPNVCFRRSESLQSVGFKPRMDEATKNVHKGRPSSWFLRNSNSSKSEEVEASVMYCRWRDQRLTLICWLVLSALELENPSRLYAAEIMVYMRWRLFWSDVLLERNQKEKK